MIIVYKKNGRLVSKYIFGISTLESKHVLQKYGEIILDFSYLQTSELHEKKIEENEALRDLDEEFRDNHIEIINRFYLLFESIHSYVIDLNHYIDELEEGFYIHQSIETVFQDPEGKQLLCEALFLYGLMLIMVDAYIDGPIRERLLVSYNRYTPQRRDTQSCFDEVCKLLMDTGANGTKKAQNYPEDYFKRVPINSNYVEMVIGRLRSDDIYSQISVYPLPKHRSTALATQAAMLYVCLFFCPKILHLEAAVMREVVDKYFPDNWIISVYMGFVINLADAWENFKSAKQALSNTLQYSNIKNVSSTHGKNVPQLLSATSNLLKEGNITSDSLLKHINSILNTLRQCNVTLRWLILHTVIKPGTTEKNKKLKHYRDQVISEINCDQVSLFKLLLNTAQLELVTKELYKSLMSEKDFQWENLKKSSCKNLIELSEVFSGDKPLTRIQKNSDLERWFKEISNEVQSLGREDVSSSRKLVQLIQALEEVQEYHQLDNNMQVVQFLHETSNNLHQMIRTMTIKEDDLINMQIIGDISYAWELVDFYTNIMQNGIKKEPKLVIKLRAVFLKLASALELPLLRINQAHSEDLISVSEYYSKELEIYVRKVLQIIPSTMFENLARIIQMQTSVIKEIPTRVDKDKLKEYAQLDERFEFAELTHSISIFSQGMRMMKSTLVGVVCLDPKQLLEDGIRKELVQHIAKALHNEFIFSAKPKQDELEAKLKTLGQIMDGYKRSFEYIQDYININGLKIWQEEVTRIVNYNVEQECNGFLRNKVHPWQSTYQSRYVPIPIHPPIDESENFIGRLAREVIRLTHPKVAVYLPTTSTWYDIKNHKPLFNKETIVSIAKAIEITGVVGLDRLFSFMITTALQRIIAHLENKNIKNSSWVNVITTIKNDMRQRTDWSSPYKIYSAYVNRTTKIWSEFLEKILLVGQLQLLRTLIAFHLNKTCRFNAKILESSLRSFNKSLLLDLKKGNTQLSEEFMVKLSEYFNYAGLNEPFNKVYVTTRNDKDYALILFLFVLVHVKFMFLPQNLASINKRTNDQLDGVALSVSVHTILKQFHSEVNEEFIKLLAEFVMQLSKNNGSKTFETLPEVTMMLNFLDCYTEYSESSRQYCRQYLPEEFVQIQQSLTSNSSV
ncbi:WASH complex subunit 5 isoform X2 [Anthonomus grandis grandis]|uniref:WASH complex subunit 5 isoform X2 n=1 Tax=Anthonomus grandis grandis TaxID=2921223 RepID=UPI00216651F5|nr:WASH complex subunit 5 isoform X2 [Anthonomus grandis grandis]